MKLKNYSKYLGILLALSVISCNVTPISNTNNTNTSVNSTIKKINKISVNLKGIKDNKPTGVSFTVRIKGNGFRVKNDSLTGEEQKTDTISTNETTKTEEVTKEEEVNSYHIFLTDTLSDPFAEGANPSEEDTKWQLESAEEVEVTFENVPEGGPYYAMVSPDTENIEENTEKEITEEDKLRDWTSSLNSVSIDSNLNLNISDGSDELIVQQKEETEFTSPAENQFINNAILEDSEDKDENGKYISLEAFPIGKEFTPKNIIVRVNDDDENKNNNIDLLETKVDNENDLVPIKPVSQEDFIIIDKFEKGEQKIKLWLDANKVNPYTIGEKAKAIYIEGIKVSDAIKDVQLSYTILGKEENTENVVFVTVVGIESVVYSTNPTLEADPNFSGTSISNPGKRAFVENIRNVSVTTKVKPVIEGLPVKMIIVDVDDPSAEKNETDPENTTEDNRDNSNNGEETWLSTKDKVNTLRTNSDGLIRSTFQLPLQPGDNLRIASTLDITHNPESRYHDNNALVYHSGSSNPLLDQRSPLSFQAKSSDLLTIWRKLNIYNVSMNAPAKFGDNDEKTGLVQSVTAVNAITYTITINETLEPSLYDMGLLRINGNDYLVNSNTENTITVIANPAAGQVPPVKGVKYELWDDDVFLVSPASKFFPNIGGGRKLLPRKGFTAIEQNSIIAFYKPAYILPEFPEILKTVPFLKNIESGNGFLAFKDNDQINYIQDIYSTTFKPLASTRLNWNVFIVFAFQGDDGSDSDGNDKTTEKANTLRENQTTLLFMETIREISLSNQGILAQIVSHEIGHNFKHYGTSAETAPEPCSAKIPPPPHSLNEGGHTQEGLMRPGSCPRPFSPFSLDLLRKTQIPGQ